MRKSRASATPTTNGRSHVFLASPHVEEDYGGKDEDERKDPDYWRVTLPSDDLDDLMWGLQGVPAPASSSTPKFQKSWAKKELPNDDEDRMDDRAHEDSEVQHNDNISAAIDSATSVADPPDEVILEDIVWKQRSGFGKYYLGIVNHEWEQRRVALFASGKLRYYALVSPTPEAVKTDPNHAASSVNRPWAFNAEPRGEMNLNSRVKLKSRRRSDNPGPTPFEIDVIHRDTNCIWRFCFISQSIQAEWMSYLKMTTRSVDGEEANSDDSDDDDVDDPSEGLDNHGFKPGDHIIRWEMLPIIYPIQIHGIVLEVGKNCIIIADFGLTSYAGHGGSEELDTWEEKESESHDFIMQTWEKIKPKEKKRLNILVITDPKEIRKWSRISYGDRVEETNKEKKGFFSSLLGGKSPNTKKKKSTTLKQDSIDKENQSHASSIENMIITARKCQDPDTTHDVNTDVCQDVDRVEGEPEWFHSGFRARARTRSSDGPIVFNDGQSVFSVDRPVGKISKLPKSDSAKLVLARTHFILENEDLLPPYHIFYSNSECLAVWCKTGRWSTLQAAVYLCSSAVGFGKSATMLTVSVAAAHIVLLPALAVGGLAVVGAPLLYLKKSQAKWDRATMRITEEFWSRAGPEVFVEAIEYWGGLRSE